MIDRLLPTFAPRLPALLVALCTAYAAMLLTNNLVWPRSLCFALMCAATLLTMATHRAATLARLRAGGGTLVMMLLWFLWSTASLAWTVEPRFSVREWETELQYGAFVFLAFFIAVRDARDLVHLVRGVLVAFVLLGLAAFALSFRQGGFDPTAWHHDVGVWSTHLVLVAPLLLVVLMGTDGAATSRRTVLAFAALLVLLLVNARLTDNRIVWLAFAAVYGSAAIVAAVRWRASFGQLRWRHLAPLAALFIVLAFAFADVVHEKAELHYPATMSVSQVLENDPRIELWKTAIEKIRAQPWFGYGFGRGILRVQLPAELHDLALTHPHNTFVGQWLETGAIGIALFVAMLAALVLRYVRFVRSDDRMLGLVGVVGIALVAGFMVKNLTDDFFYRSNAKLFWALNGMLLATGICRGREQVLVSGPRPVGFAASSP